MPTTVLGTWRKPPLVYVVAELVISPYYSLASHIAGLQDRLRSSFPQTLEGSPLVVDGTAPGAQTMWQLLSADRSLGVHLGSRTIALHATSYQTSSDFLDRWANVLDAVQDARLEPFVVRAGLRYIDLIVPTDGKDPAEYLVDGMKGIVPEGARCTGSMWAAAFQFDSAIVNLRAGAPSPPGMLLPPDFNALLLAKPAMMLEAEACLQADLQIGFVDTDCIKEINRVFDASDLLGDFAVMQSLNSRTFKSALSNFALGEWM